ncbi:MAG TPA: hypothetical protein ENJ82_04135 [Bacteroidetes bacterium]|nr:hypothetical protein [Bacteroidota bacterium]
MPIRKYVLFQLGVVALLLGLAYWPVTTWLEEGALTFSYIAIIISGLSGIVSYIIVYRGIETSIRMFTTYIIGSMLAKMMIGLASITIIALKFKDFATVYVLIYFFCYFIFTFFEVSALMRKLRPISKTGKRNTHEEDPAK